MRSREKLHSIVLVSITLVLLLSFISSTTSASTAQPADGQLLFTEVQITNNKSLQGYPDIFGDKIVWQDNRNGNWDIYMYDLSTSTGTQITTSTSQQVSSAIHGNKIVWQDNRNGNWDIYMYDLSTHKETQITTNQSDQLNPAIYGDKIVWTDWRNEIPMLYSNLDIYMYDLSTSKEIQITTNKSDQNSPAIYEDRIVWYDSRNGDYDIYMFNLSTSTETQITTNTLSQSDPDIYGDRIVWTDARNGNYDIYMYNLSTYNETQITTNQSYQSTPAIYKDSIVWTQIGYANEQDNIYMYNLSKCEEIQLTSNSSTSPAIYGDKVIWKGERNGNEVIYMGIIGSNLSIASFSALPSSGDAPLKVEYTDKSIVLPTSWKWDFGDGTSSTEQNPVHTYSKAGEYTVKLVASDGRNTASNTLEIVVYEVKVLPVANFSSNVTKGYAPLSARFTDLSQYSTERIWDFNNDGVIDSNERTPSFVYTFPGNYTVNLTVNNENGTTSKLSQIIVNPTELQNCEFIIKETQITSDKSVPSEEFNPVIYGDRIVWQDSRNSYSNIYMYNLSTQEETQITSNDSNDISPIIYEDSIAWIGYDRISTNICVYDILTPKGIRTITDGVDHIRPAIYGDRIVSEGIHSGVDVYMYDLSTSIETQITKNKSIQKNPDIYENKIIWQDDRNGKKDLYVYDISTSKESEIPTNGSVENPVIYGDRIVWEDDRNGNNDIYMFNLSTFSELQITTNMSNSENPAIYGDKIVWQDDRNGYWDIYMYDLSSFTETRITTNASNSENPAIYGDKIVWQDDRNGFWDIYMCTVSGKELNSILPVANFSSNVTKGYIPLSVRFTDLSQYATTRVWDFDNDEIKDSTEKTPVYLYSVPGIYIVNLTVSNANGSVSKLDTITVLTKSNSGGGSSGGSSHSNGGGGGAGGSPEPAKNVEVKELCQVFVINGKFVKFDFTKNATCVISVSFDSKKTAGKTTAIVEMLKNKSTLTPKAPPGEVYNYLNIWVSNSGYATEKNLENAFICFKVKKSWIQEKDINQSSILLNRYSDKKWNELPTTLLNEDDKYVYFTAQTPGFSPFAITGKKMVKRTGAETQPESSIRDVPGNNTSTVDIQETDPKEVASTPGFETIYGIACMFGAFLYRRG